VLALAGLAMIIPLFVPSRCRSRRVVTAAAPYEATPGDYPDLGTTQTIGGGGLPTEWTETRPQPRAEPGPAQAPWGPADPGNPGSSGSTSGYG